ncbi:MAG: lysophospholipid acyltransferase family protein [Burkholderiales bacterium]|nr:lysophospholipid acyltransferase family protein [Burkholderiales bacterium]
MPRALGVLFRAVATLPLPVVHFLGAAAGRAALRLAAAERRRLAEHLRAAGYDDVRLARAAAAEAGKLLLEMIWLWQRPTEEVIKLVRSVDGEQIVAEASARGKGVIFLTPHLGCFEIAAQYAGALAPITVLYRSPRQRMLRAFARAGRQRGNVRLVEANTRGATALLGALRRGEWVGVLPDQVPARGEGEWAEFFGSPAFTMTLTTRLEQRTGAAVILCFCERLPRGKGYRIHLERPGPREAGESAARHLNRSLEALIRRRPEQYLWSYNRYKSPANVAPAERAERAEGA